jgi:hypothetical protein
MATCYDKATKDAKANYDITNDDEHDELSSKTIVQLVILRGVARIEFDEQDGY